MEEKLQYGFKNKHTNTPKQTPLHDLWISFQRSTPVVWDFCWLADHFSRATLMKEFSLCLHATHFLGPWPLLILLFVLFFFFPPASSFALLLLPNTSQSPSLASPPASKMCYIPWEKVQHNKIKNISLKIYSQHIQFSLLYSRFVYSED